jgi:hypothetical protein
VGGGEPTVALPASRLFSRSSFVAVARLMTTWPEQIRWTEAESMGLIDPVISSTYTLSQRSIIRAGGISRKRGNSQGLVGGWQLYREIPNFLTHVLHLSSRR